MPLSIVIAAPYSVAGAVFDAGSNDDPTIDVFLIKHPTGINFFNLPMEDISSPVLQMSIVEVDSVSLGWIELSDAG